MFKKTHILFALILLFGLFIRMVGISEQGLTSDEITWTKRSTEYVAQIFEPFNIAYMKKYEGYDGYPLNNEGRKSYPFNIRVGTPHPGTGNALLMGFSIYLFGEDTSSFTRNLLPDYVAARVPQIIFGTIAIVVLYLLGTIFFNQNIGLVASGILSFEPLAVGLSRLAHIDMALTFGLLVANIFYLLGCMKDKKYFIYSGVFWGWSLSLKPYAWFFLVAIISWQVLVIILSWLGIKRLDDLSPQRLIYLVKGHLNLVIIGVLVFIIFYPNLWSNLFPNLISYFKSFLSLPQVRMDNTYNFPTIKSYYITYGLLHITIPMLIFCLIGILGILRDIKLEYNTSKLHKETALLYFVFFTFIYILMLSLPGGKKEARNMVVIFPYLSLLGAIGFFLLTEFMCKIIPH
ncbi:MAG TPA: glycosyltransferase family 39 protein, partial [Chryseolinea sp.]|nr:glycosyltransferase family 39 protein [Chryseolinea sp.]